MARYSVQELIVEIRRQAEQRNATWPCVLLSDMILLCDEYEKLHESILNQPKQQELFT